MWAGPPKWSVSDAWLQMPCGMGRLGAPQLQRPQCPGRPRPAPGRAIFWHQSRWDEQDVTHAVDNFRQRRGNADRRSICSGCSGLFESARPAGCWYCLDFCTTILSIPACMTACALRAISLWRRGSALAGDIQLDSSGFLDVAECWRRARALPIDIPEGNASLAYKSLWARHDYG
jgi:hypothetical protein